MSHKISYKFYLKHFLCIEMYTHINIVELCGFCLLCTMHLASLEFVLRALFKESVTTNVLMYA